MILQTNTQDLQINITPWPCNWKQMVLEKNSYSNRGQTPIFKNNNTELLLTIMYNTPSEIEFYTHNH